MNDTELDELLNTWSAPPAPASLRESVRVGFVANLKRKTSPGKWRWIATFVPSARKSLLAGSILAVGAFFFVVALALSQTHRIVAPPAGVPYIVDSEFVRYSDDGSPSVVMYTTSYSLDEHEILLSRSLPGYPFGTAIGRTLDAALPYLFRLRSRFEDADLVRKIRRAAAQAVTVTTCWGPCLMLAHYGFARSGGVGCLDGPIVGRETILNYPTVAVQHNDGGSPRMTLWMARDLGCFALRITVEEKQPDGTYRLVTTKQAVKVTMNREMQPPALK
jgi:hypothetical protein